jgi:P4 family phage/plasmid primase-like protien
MQNENFRDNLAQLPDWLNALAMARRENRPDIFPWIHDHKVAGVLWADKYGRKELWLYKGEIWQFNGKQYIKVPMSQVEYEVQHWLTDNGHPNASSAKTKGITEALMSWVEVRHQVGSGLGEPAAMPFWLTSNGQHDEYLHFDNGLVNLHDLLLKGEAKLKPHTPDFFCQEGFPYEYNAKAECPLWEAHLDYIFEGDHQRTLLLQEWFGYCLVPDLQFQKAMFLEGEGQNGKTVCELCLVRLIGADRVSHVGLKDLATQYSLMKAEGKLVNICDDLGKIGRESEVVFKQLTGGGKVQIDRKYLDPHAPRLTLRFLITMNGRPQLKDRSNALWRRIIIIPFHLEIPNDVKRPEFLEDEKPTWPFYPELPGMFNWAMRGLRRLYQRGRFTEPPLCVEAHEEWVGESDPVKRFLQLHYEENPDGVVGKDEMLNRYMAWSGRNENRITFGKRVKSQFRKTTDTKITAEEERVPAFKGIHVKPDIQRQWNEEAES